MIFLIWFIAFITPTRAFFRHLCFGELATARIDPIMAPGRASQHAHAIFGASNFGLDPSIEDLLSSNCTSCSIVQDKSVYWAPRLYFQHANGTFEMVPTSGGMTVYYFTERPNTGDVIVPFPQNFRMIAGNSLKRSFYGAKPDPPMAEWKEQDITQQALMEKSIGFNCLHYGPGNEGSLEHHELRDKTFIDQYCTDGVRAELQFPSCWNGRDLDSANHTTHVAYPTQLRNGPCPPDHPVRLPTLFYETIYQTNLYKGIQGEFTLANGDPTGNGYHGDFICGWEEGVLQAAIDNPHCTTHAGVGFESTGDQNLCPAFTVQDPSVGTTCKLEIPEILQHEQINGIPALPGNVKIQYGPEPATIAGATSSAAPNTTALPVPPEPTPGPAATPTSANGNATATRTSIFVSDGVEIHMVVVEEVVTETVFAESTASTTGSSQHKRHAHSHAHGYRARL